MKAGFKRDAADKAARAEAVMQRWNDQLALGRDMLWSPTMRAALLAGTRLPVRSLWPAHRTGRSSRPAIPSVRLRPVWPCNDNGCKANERPEPPNNTLAPTPTPAVISPLAPT
jgi:hypothetical protein